MYRNLLSLGFIVSILLVFVAVSYANDEKKSDTKLKEQKLEPGAKLKLKFRRATKQAETKKNEEEEDGKVEVVKDKESRKEDKERNENEKKNEETSADDEDEEEEMDPNAKIEIEELYLPQDCVNKSKNGDLVVVHYTGRLGLEGENFDTTIDPLKGYVPFEFLLGGGSVIKGFEDGVRGMCKGEKRRIVIPPSLGYGKKGANEIPGNLKLKEV